MRAGSLRIYQAIVLVFSCGVLVACSQSQRTSSPQIGPTRVPQTSQLPQDLAPRQESSPQGSPIRSIDFANFKYPESSGRRTFVLKDNKEPVTEDARFLADVVYGDVTGDGQEDALVVQSQDSRGTAILYVVYVYTIRLGKPRCLWSFYAGDRGDGGIRRIAGVGGHLMIELYGRDRFVNGGTSGDEDNHGVCCPRFFTRSRYDWDGRRFTLVQKEAALPNPDVGARYYESDENK